MDLDELKHQLKDKLSSDHAGRSDSDIAALLNTRTSSVVGKLKKSLLIEIWFGVLVVIAFAGIGLFSKYANLRIYFSVFAVLCAAFVGLLVFLLRRTSQLSGTAMPVKKNLQIIVKIIEEFMKRYFQFTMALIPVCFTFSLFLGFREPEQIPEVDRIATGIFTKSWQVWVFFFSYLALLTAGIYYFTKWYLKKLYGKYINQLKECIEELHED
ncbi:MAG: hypothetical protein JWQ78_1192 [Sediminibacterium sp.]|nr:hypothetical protein [Sediminibacterium sp.]